jgi:hypothetical protein
MKNPLFGIDVQKHANSDTEVVFWRHDLKHPKTATRHSIYVRTEATLNRLRRLLPPPNASIDVYPKKDYLSIDFMWNPEAQK